MSFSEHYDGYRWIKVKKYTFNPSVSLQENYEIFQQHHIEETSYLIDEIRNLAMKLDEATKKNEELRYTIACLKKTVEQHREYNKFKAKYDLDYLPYEEDYDR